MHCGSHCYTFQILKYIFARVGECLVCFLKPSLKKLIFKLSLDSNLGMSRIPKPSLTSKPSVSKSLNCFLKQPVLFQFLFVGKTIAIIDHKEQNMSLFLMFGNGFLSEGLSTKFPSSLHFQISLPIYNTFWT